MEQVEQVVEETDGRIVNSLADGLAVSRLDHLQIPAGELVPEELIDSHQGFAQAVLAEEVGHFEGYGVLLRLEPLHGQGGCFGHFDLGAHFPTLDEAEGVPYLVVEVTALLAQGVVEEDVVAGRSRKHHTHAHTVGTIAFDEVERVGRVAQRLGHLASQLVAHDTCEVHVAERHVAHVFVSGHDHAGHPEEDDVRACHQVARRIVVFDFLVAGVVDAVEQGDGPQPGREPRVEAIFVLTQIFQLQVGLAGLLLGQFESLLGRLGHHVSAFGQEVGRDAVSPPQLAADTPVLDVLQPVLVRVLVLSGIELQFVVHDRRQSHVGKVLHLEEPLHGELRLDGYVGTLGEAHLVGVSLHLLQQAGGGEVFFNLFAHVEAVHAYVQAGGFAQGAVVVEDVDARQVVLLAQHVVVHVVGRRHLQTARTELYVHVIILNDGDDTTYKGHDDFLTLQPLVLGVGRIDTHGRIAHDSLRAGRGNYGIATAFGIAVNHFTLGAGFARHVVIGHIIFQIVELAVLFLINHFLVAQGGQRLGVPVHHAHTAVDESLVIQVDKHLDDALAALLVHGEGRAVPVA